jgi:hypothetical protein
MDDFLDRFDLVIRNCDRHSSRPHDLGDAGNDQNGQSMRDVEFAKDVSGKEGEF